MTTVRTILEETGESYEVKWVEFFTDPPDPDFVALIGVGDPKRPAFLQWLHYLATASQADVIFQFHPENYFSDRGDQEQFMTASLKCLAKVLVGTDL